MMRKKLRLSRLWAVSVLLSVMAGAMAQAQDVSLMALWKLDDGTGAVAQDSSGNENHGTVNNETGGLGAGGSVWAEDAERGTVISFDGANYVDTDFIVPAMTLTNGFTWAFWAKPHADQEANNDVILGNRYGGTSSPLQFIKFTPTNFEYYNGANYGLAYDDITETVWTHHVVVKEGASLSYYCDGVLSLTTTISNTVDENPFYMGADGYSGVQEAWQGYLSDVRLYDGALSVEQIQAVMDGAGLDVATSPVPADGATDVPRDATLNWTASKDAVAHDVYFGASSDDVAQASRSNPLDVLVAEGQAATRYDTDRLTFEQTYYWRVDDVDADGEVHAGLVWSFTVEPYVYAIANITATATGTSNADGGPENTINGSGLDEDNQHSVESVDMWHVIPAEGEVVQIQYEFDRPYCLYQMWVWNHNVSLEHLLNFGVKDVTVEYSTDGAEWTVFSDVEVTQAPGADTYVTDTIVDFGNVVAQYVRLTVNSGWGTLGQYGLSEVRFLYVPIWAREPVPTSGATDQDPALTLGWRIGRQAAQHNVYLDTDEQAVIDGTASMATVSESSYEATLDLNQTYYWRVDEVNDAEDPAVWEGDVWTFSTSESLAVEDFEGYTDAEGNEVFSVWVDGWTNGTGSTVGYLTTPFAETILAHSGAQSMPLAYENTGGVTVSEAEWTFDVAQDWGQHGIKSLSLCFFGDPENTTGQLYVEIDGTKVLYDGSAEDMKIAAWVPWIIDLTNKNVQSVRTLKIGIEGSGASGLLLVDDIRAYPYDGQMVDAVDPGTESLVAYYPLDGDASDAAGGHDGTISGTPDFVTGYDGQAIDLASAATTAQYISVPYAADFALNSFTVAAWINVKDLDALRAIVGTRFNADYTFDCKVSSTYVHGDIGNGSAWLSTALNIDAAHGGVISIGDWHHIAYTIDAVSGTAGIYLDGVLGATVTFTGTPVLMSPSQELRIGNCSGVEYMNGMIDEVRIYNRALSAGEVAGLVGRPGPLYLPF